MALIDASRGDTAWLPRHRPKYHRAFELSCKNGTRLNIGLDPVFCDPHGSPRDACIRSFLDPATQNPTTMLERGRLRVGQLIVSVNGSPCDSRPFHMILNGIKTTLARSRGNLDLGLAFPSDDAMGGRMFTTTPSVVRSGGWGGWKRNVSIEGRLYSGACPLCVVFCSCFLCSIVLRFMCTSISVCVCVVL